MAACEITADERGLEIDQSAVDSASVAFRYANDLITGEETERWLEDRNLSLEEFSNYFARQQWGRALSATTSEKSYLDATPEERERFAADAILSGAFDRWSEVYSRRVAALADRDSTAATPELRADLLQRAGTSEEGLPAWLGRLERTPEWFEENLRSEAAFDDQIKSLVTEKDLARELVSLRLSLTCFEIETVEVDSRDAASEVLACVRNDGMEMAEVAEEGRYPYHEETLLLEDLPSDQQQRYLSAKAGALLEPTPREEEFEVTRVRTRTEPTLEDKAVRARIEERIVARHFAALVGKFITWRLLPPSE